MISDDDKSGEGKFRPLRVKQPEAAKPAPAPAPAPAREAISNSERLLRETIGNLRDTVDALDRSSRRPLPSIKVDAPDVKVEATIVNVKPAEVTVRPEFNVKAPNVTVEAPNVTVNSPTEWRFEVLTYDGEGAARRIKTFVAKAIK